MYFGSKCTNKDKSRTICTPERCIIDKLLNEKEFWTREKVVEPITKKNDLCQMLFYIAPAKEMLARYKNSLRN